MYHKEEAIDCCDREEKKKQGELLSFCLFPPSTYSRSFKQFLCNAPIDDYKDSLLFLQLLLSLLCF